MSTHRPARARVWPALLLVLTLAPPLHAQPADAPPGPALVLTPDAYFAAVQAWVQEAEAASLDPTLSPILRAGRAAAEQGDWTGAQTAVENAATANPPAGLLPLLRGMVAAGRGDTPAHLEHLAQAAPALAAAGETDLAVDTWRYLAHMSAGRGARDAAHA